MRNLLVLGSGRSGTSMVAGTLSASGWWVGDEPYRARGANPKGFFETAEINGINEELLARVLPAGARFEHGQRWLCTLEPGVEVPLDEALRARIGRLVARTPFAFKDPRLCYTLPAWEPLLPAGTGRVCVFREPSATAASIVKECADAPYLASLEMDEERALAVWTCMYERVLAQSTRGDWHFVHFDQMLTQDGLASLEDFAGSGLDRRFPEASLRRSRTEVPAVGRAAEIYRELCERAGHCPDARTQVAPGGIAPELSVILCTYQRLPILQRSIASFEAQDARPGSFELIVVDDGCSDGSREWLDSHPFRVPARVLHKQNGGLASARNVGIAAARGRILLFVNDDTLAFPDLVREHLRAHAELAAAGVEASVLGSFEQPSTQLSSALMRHLESSGEVFRYHDMRAGEFYDHNRFWTCNVSAPAARVREAGDFDERFKRYGCEDIDLGLRLERLGLRVCYHPGARAHHEHVLDFAAFQRRQRSCSASFVHLFGKHPSELDHPDWNWLAGRSADSMRAELAQRAARRAELEAAVATLACVELVPLEALGERELVQQTLARLGALLRELNALWWQEGLIQGLGELGCAGFDELRAREPQTAFGGLRGAFEEAHVRAQLALARTEAQAGERDLALLRLVGIGCALQQAGPQFGAQIEDVRAQLDLLRRSTPAVEAEAPAQTVERARKQANLLRARVLWLGYAPPLEPLLAAGARSVRCEHELTSLEPASIDVVLGAWREATAPLAEIARVLRSGGRWLCSAGPRGTRSGLPGFAHLLLDERELGWCREPCGEPGFDSAAVAERLALAGFDCAGLKPVGLPGPALLRLLRRAHPGRTEFGSAALEGLLVRRGKTILIGSLAASAAGA